jgi:hypothetical protein
MRRLALAAVVLAVLVEPARADVFSAPTLTAAGGTQRGAMVHATKNSAVAKNRCVSRHADYAATFPEAVRHDGSAVTWRIADARRPGSVVTTLWRLGTDKAGLGAAEDVAVTLSPVRSGTRTVAWAVTTDPLGVGDLHLDMTVTWPKGRCGSDQGRYRYRLLSAV